MYRLGSSESAAPPPPLNGPFLVRRSNCVYLPLSLSPIRLLRWSPFLDLADDLFEMGDLRSLRR